MDKIRLGNLRTDVTVTDMDSLLHPRAMAQILNMVEAHLEAKARDETQRMAETRVGPREGEPRS